MRKCLECGYDNLEGTMVCEDCGFPIVKATNMLAFEEPERVGSGKLTLGTVMLNENSDVLLEFVGFTDSIPVLPNQRTTIGRSDTKDANPPDLDLTPYGAFEKGVSRTHAALIRQEASLTLLDLGSANGTLINGRRIAANQSRVVVDGDEITFGQLVARIHFK